jgi:putative copper resistance protein D
VRQRIAQRATRLSTPRRNRTVLFVVLGTAVAGVAALVFAMWLGGNLTQSNINDIAIGGTGSFTTWGLPASKLVMDVSSIGVIGLLLACLLLPGTGREPSATARRCLRSAGRLALVWCVATAALLLFSWSDVIARPVTKLQLANLFTDTASTFPAAVDYLTNTALALVIAAAAAVIETRRGALILLPLAIYGLVVMALQGHASHGTVIKYTLIVHVVAASLWVGGLAALLLHARGEPAELAVAVPRFSTVALCCYAAIAASGIVAAWILLGSVSAVWGSRYGVVVTLKAAALIALGIFGWWHRRHTVPRIRAGTGSRSRHAFIKLAAAEVAIMVAAVAIAVALSRTASPDAILRHSQRKAAVSLMHTQQVIRG